MMYIANDMNTIHNSLHNRCYRNLMYVCVMNSDNDVCHSVDSKQAIVRLTNLSSMGQELPHT